MVKGLFRLVWFNSYFSAKDSKGKTSCDIALLHIGPPTKFTKAIQAMDCTVRILNHPEDLMGLSLKIAKEVQELDIKSFLKWRKIVVNL